MFDVLVLSYAALSFSVSSLLLTYSLKEFLILG